jgi:DNA-binding NtrC family response regulator
MNKKVLIIDDEKDIVEFISDLIELNNLNLEPLRATTVAEAKLKINSADIIISDINMPDKDQLEELLKNCNKPIARMTGFPDIQGQWVIHKPFKIENLEDVLKKMLSSLPQKN